MDNNASRSIEASGSRGLTPAGQPARKPRKKPKAAAKEPTSRPAAQSGPMPTPYLAIAPLPVSSMSQGRIDQLSGASRTGMVLPSSYTRPSLPQTHSAPGPSRSTGPSPSPDPTRRRKYAAGLLAPPAIMPGGQAATPRIQGRTSPAPGPPLSSRRRSAERVGVGGPSPPVILPAGASGGQAPTTRRRSEDRLRELGQVNSSMMSLGLLGQIMETDPTQQQEQVPPSGGRRRRVVRGEQGLARRATVSTREEGRALGVARGASMRRTNVWDDVPESTDPPPAFPFPAPSSRLPPAFEAEESRPATSPGAQSSTSTERPRSPPPSFEQAIGLVPLPPPLTSSTEIQAPLEESGPSTPQARPTLSLDTVVRPVDVSGPSSSTSPTVTQWASAPSSPVQSDLSQDAADEMGGMETAEEREDRRLWNADLLAGYTLEERVRRENERRASVVALAEEPPLSVVAPKYEVQEEQTVQIGDRSDAPFGETAQPPVRAGSPFDLGLAGHPESPLSDQEAAAQGSSSTTTPVVLEESTVPSAEDHPGRSESEQEPNGSLRVESVTDRADLGPSVTPPPDPSILDAAMDDRSPPKSPTVEDPARPTPNSEQEEPGLSLPVSTQIVTTESEPVQALAPTPEAAATATAGVLTIDTAAASTPSDSRSQSGSDRIISRSPPSRKLTRGKALRRQSSSPKGTTVRANSVRSRQSVESHQPLFAGPGYTAAELQELPIPTRIHHAHRASAPDALGIASGHEVVRLARDQIKSQPNAQDLTSGQQATRSSAILPPHREAALKRRESALGRMERRAVGHPDKEVEPIAEDGVNVTTPAVVQAESAPRPLIDFEESWENTISRSPNAEMRTLAATTAELLQLLEDDSVAESSAQGAAKAEVARAVSQMLDQQEAAAAVAVAPRKRPPPPPPSIHRKPSGGVQRKLSVLLTADSPIIVFPAPAAADDATPAPSIAPPMPTRRPPPPPPQAVTPDPTKSAPALPPRPGNGGLRPSLAPRQISTVSTGASSVSDRQDPPSSPPIPAYQPRARTSLSHRPRGPRPPPVPPRPWAKMAVQPDPTDVIPMRPPTDRTQSETSLIIDTTSPISSPVRSMSEHDLRSASVAHPPRSPEYTDLDVYVSRLEGSGREYEGFAHLTSFLGPAKNPAATPEALATLLPGLIHVDSRRQNAAGKTKLKLSLLGVRVTKCPICLSQFKEKDTGVMLPKCTHVAHEVCARRWFREDWKCFVCREPLEAEGVV